MNNNYIPTQEELEDFERWCFMQDLEEQNRMMQIFQMNRETEALL